MRILYVGRSHGVHDRRFADAWSTGGATVDALFVDEVDGAGTPPGPAFRAALRSALDRTTPDLVQVGPVTWPGFVVAELWHGPLIATSWGFDLMHEIDADPVARAHASTVLRRADRVFVDNDGPARRAVELGAAEDTLISFPWGIDQQVFTTADARGEADDVRRIVSVRRHEPIYRVTDVLEAFVTAAAADGRLRLVLAGSGSLTGALKARAEEAGVADRVEWPGELAAPQLAALFQSASLYISSSPVDGSSVSLLEAMACGVPVVVTDIEGNRQWVDDTTGWRFAPGEVPELSALMLRLARDDGDEVGSRPAAARERVRARADWTVTSARFPAFAREAIAAHADRKR